MISTFASTLLFPIYLIFALGVLLRKIGVLNRDDATVLLKVNFYLCLPALVAYSILGVDLSRSYAVLPVISIAIVFVTWGISWMVCHFMQLPSATRGTFLVGTLIMNVASMYPIIHGLYGTQGVSQVAIFDVGQGIMAFSFTYFWACWYSEQSKSGQLSEALVKMFGSPPLWAIVLAILLNLFHVPLPATLQNTLLFLGNGTTPLIMLAMGILFTPAVKKLHIMLPALAIRMIGGSVLAWLFTLIFQIEGDMRLIVILGAAAPAGQTTLTFSVLKHLDVELAASLVPISVLFSMFYLPLLLALFW
jgi:predicted permease